MGVEAADVFRAVGRPMRLRILGLLRGGERSVSELVEGVESSAPNLSHQLNELRYAGLIDRERRGVFHYCRLTELGEKVLDFAEGMP